LIVNKSNDANYVFIQRAMNSKYENISSIMENTMYAQPKGTNFYFTLFILKRMEQKEKRHTHEKVSI